MVPGPTPSCKKKRLNYRQGKESNRDRDSVGEREVI